MVKATHLPCFPFYLASHARKKKTQDRNLPEQKMAWLPFTSADQETSKLSVNQYLIISHTYFLFHFHKDEHQTKLQNGKTRSSGVI